MNLSSIYNIKNKVVIVTGGSGFLGTHYCDLFESLGAQPVNVDLKSDYPADITDEKQVTKVIQKVYKKFKRIDVLINNASFNIHLDSKSIKSKKNKFDYLSPVEDYSLEAYKKGLEVDLIGSFLISKIVLPFMKKQRSGSIINIGSIYGVTSPDQRLYSGMKNPNRPGLDIVKPAYYSVAKAGLWGLTRYLAGYAAPIRVNQLTLGGIRNQEANKFLVRYAQKTMLGRMGEVSDIDGALVFLATDASKYITGTNLVVDGGFTAW